MRLLLDSQVPKALAEQLRRRGIDAVHLADWMGSDYLDKPDRAILAAAYSDSRVMITFDCRTVTSLAVEWAENDLHHAGILLVDDRTFRPNDVGGLLRAILRQVEASGDDNWEDHVIFLPSG